MKTQKAPALKELYKLRQAYFQGIGYKMTHFDEWDYSLLEKIIYLKRTFKRDGEYQQELYNDVVIMADTETSKSGSAAVLDNHVVAWSISIRAFHTNIVTLWGQKPSDLVATLQRIHESMRGQKTVIYFHNYSYDYVFMRKFMFKEWGYPVRQLNTKPHYPVSMEFANGIIIKDSLILAQRSLDKWAKDMRADHQKALGSWEYNRIRHQSDTLTQAELTYIEHDTLAGVECLDLTMIVLNKRIYTIPLTATGIPRDNVKRIGKKNRAHERFMQMVPDLYLYAKLHHLYHGGYAHANRGLIGWIIGPEENTKVYCLDFASSYPYVLLSEKYPMERFSRIDDCSIQDIFKYMNDYAILMTFRATNIRLKDGCDMPVLQFSKCREKINAVTDNGRILKADFIEIDLTEIDFLLIYQMYEWDDFRIMDCWAAAKAYLPRWLTDYIFELFVAKSELKTGDPVLYAIAKGKLNSIYGLMVQNSIREEIKENYETGEFDFVKESAESQYNRYLEKYDNVLVYQWGVYVTAYALRNLFELGSCAGTWIYSDTDSIYGYDINWDAVEAYNEECKEKLRANGYGPAVVNDKEYWLGVATIDKVCSQFITQGAKRYAYRKAGVADIMPVYGPPFRPDQLNITVAGVPKSGVKCLKDDINNFRPGMIFDGETTGKLQHTHIFNDDIYINQYGDEVGDSIDLTPCDYKLSSIYTVSWNDIDYTEIETYQLD